MKDSSKKKDARQSIETLLRKASRDSKVDFDKLVQEHGFVKARQLLKRATVEEHQAQVQDEESKVHNDTEALRMHNTIQRSATHGSVSQLTLLNKILSSNKSIKELERIALEGGDLSSQLLTQIRKHEASQPADEYLQNTSIQYALANNDNTLLISNANLEELPLELADTLHLQTSYLKRISCTRNAIKTLTSCRMPQFSFYHLRYVRVMNLSFNNIRRLPDNFGALLYLEELNLSNNTISKLPASVFNLKTVHTLDLSVNSIAALPFEFTNLSNLTDLNLSQNLFMSFPVAICKLERIRFVKFSRNSLNHLAVLPPLLQREDMFIKTFDSRTGKVVFVNILTKERVSHVEKYSGAAIKKQSDLHVFQSEDSRNILRYRRRKLWLSVCQVHEWEPDVDMSTGLWYFKNNVSGSTSWTLPQSLAGFGAMDVLEEMDLTSNAIKALPFSFTALQRLRKIVLKGNRLRALPEDIGIMSSLEHLNLSSNELQLLPVSICDCKSLKELLLDDNHLIRLPERMGYMTAIEKLDVSVNRLKRIPFTLGFCETIKSIIVLENPLEDPPVREFDKSIEEIRWYLRNRFFIEERGMPPQMQFHTIGVNDEVTILKTELSETVHQKILGAKREGFLNLSLLGLTEIPEEVLLAKGVTKIKFDFNNKLRIEEFPIEIAGVESLSFKSCKLPSIPHNIHIFNKLTTLNLEDNHLEILPEGFTELVTLTNLNLSKNRLYELPADFYKLRRLTSLNLESNYLELIPSEVGKMRKMYQINLSKNRLIDIPDTLCDLSELRLLNVEKNVLRFLPRRLAQMSLIELKCGHNLIERLADDLFAYKLGKTIDLFSCVENNLLELPNSLGMVKPRCMLEADYNPLVSPPPYLLSEGFTVLQNYLQIRFARRRELFSLIKDEDFELSLTSFSPVACEVLEDGTGFLTPEDLSSFDAAVHEYTNGEYYRCPATAEEIVGRLVILREERETDLYLLILRTLLNVINRITTSEDTALCDRYKQSVFSAQRPWGRNSENCNVWVISLAALLRDQTPNKFYPDGRESIFGMIADDMPPIAFPFTVDLLKDSLRLYQSPYGQVADTEKVAFPTCDCIDEVKNKPKRHMPCNKAAVVLVKSVYVGEEADRREIEESEFLERFAGVEDEMRIWFSTEEGRRELDKEIRRRKNVLKDEISLREEMMTSLELRLKKCVDAINKLEKRKALFESGAGIESHGFNSIDEAIQQISVQRVGEEEANDKIKHIDEQLTKFKTELGLDWKIAYLQAMEDLVRKYCVKAYDSAVYSFRRHATEHDLQRHWDGDEGKAFAEWKRLHVVKDLAGNLRFSSDPNFNNKINDDEDEEDEEARKEEEAAKKAASLQNGMLAPEYDWQDTDDMDVYKLPVYDRYRTERGPLPLVK